MRVELGPKVIAFIRTLAPAPKRAVRRALRLLEDGKGDIKALEKRLAGYQRLRVMTYRIIFFYVDAEGGNERYIRCVAAGHRSVVYTNPKQPCPRRKARRHPYNPPAPCLLLPAPPPAPAVPAAPSTAGLTSRRSTLILPA